MPTTLKILTVSDLHRSRSLYRLLREAVEQHRADVLAVVGDFLDAFGGSDKLSNEECALLLSKLPSKEIVFVRGNHEDDAWLPFATAWPHARRKLHALHGEAFVHGPLVIIGFPSLLGVEDAFVGTRTPLPVDPELWLAETLRPFSAAPRTLWLMHEPPFGTPLSQREGPLAGNLEWVVAIHRWSPWLTVSGHDHRSPI